MHIPGLSDAIKKIRDLGTSVVRSAKTAIGEAEHKAKDAVEDAGHEVSGGLKKLGQTIRTDIRKAGTDVENGLHDVGNELKEDFQHAVNALHHVDWDGIAERAIKSIQRVEPEVRTIEVGFEEELDVVVQLAKAGVSISFDVPKPSTQIAAIRNLYKDIAHKKWDAVVQFVKAVRPLNMAISETAGALGVSFKNTDTYTDPWKTIEDIVKRHKHK